MIRLPELTPQEVEVVARQPVPPPVVRTGGCMSASTIRTAHRILSVALKEAVARGRDGAEPVLVRVTAEGGAPGDADTELGGGRADPGRCETWPNGARWVLAISTGLRQGEALGLRWLDVQLDERPRCHVRQALTRIGGEWVFKRPKSDKSYGRAALPPVAVDALRGTGGRRRRSSAAGPGVHHGPMASRGTRRPTWTTGGRCWPIWGCRRTGCMICGIRRRRRCWRWGRTSRSFRRSWGTARRR